MATEATVQVPDSSVDVAGVSVVSATRSVANPRNGTIYNPTTFAAGVPIWFHRLQDGRYLGLFKKRWIAATGVYHDGPQMFSAHTEVTTPGFAIIDPTTGTCDGPFLPPAATVGTTTINAAVSRGNYLFVLGTKDSEAWVWHYLITRMGGLQLQGEEAVPLGFDLGLYADGFHLWVFGVGDDGKLARIRKNWGRIGNNSDLQMQWECEAAKGWYTDFDEAESLPGSLPAAGPCSVAKFRDRFYLVTTDHAAGAYFSTIYFKRVVDQVWKITGGMPLALGADALYMGGSAYVQPQLVPKANPEPGVNAVFPYVTSVKVIAGSDQAILTEWGVIAV